MVIFTEGMTWACEALSNSKKRMLRCQQRIRLNAEQSA